MSIKPDSKVTYIVTDEDAAVSIEQHQRDMEAFVECYPTKTIADFVSYGVRYITRDQKPCLVTLHGGLMYNFADDGALFSFLNSAFKLGFDFCQKFVCVDFCRWYDRERRSKITTAVIGDENWMPTPKDIEHIQNLEIQTYNDPSAKLFVCPESIGHPTSHSMRLIADMVFKSEHEPMVLSGWHDSYRKDETVTFPLKSDPEAPLTFSDAAFKIIQDYIHACDFFHPYAPTMLDYANALLAYRLGYQISQEKVSGEIGALHSLRSEVTHYVKNHPDRCANLRAEPDINILNMTLYSDRLVLRSDYGRVVVTYEPNVTTVEWEKRYTDLRTRHGQR